MAKKGSQLTVRTATEIQGGEFVILGYAGRSYQMTLDELKMFIGIIEADGGSVDLTQVSTDILPLADASKDIGSLEKRWKKVYSTALTVKAQSVDEEEVNIHDGGIEGKIGQDIQWSIDGNGRANFYELTVNGADVATMQYVNNELSKYVTTDTLAKNYVSNTSLAEILKKYYESGYVDYLLSSKASTGDLNKTNAQLGIVQTDVATLKSYFQDTDDVDDIINKWRELEAFLAGQTETSTLADLLSVKADKSTVVAINSRVTDLEDADFVDIDSFRSTLESYYTKEQVNALLGEAGSVDLTGYINSVGEEGSGNVVTGYRKSGKSLALQKGLSVYSKTEVDKLIGGISIPSLDGYVTNNALTESLNNLASTYLSFRGGGTVSGATTFSGGLSVQNSLTLLGVNVAAGSSGLTFGGKIPMYSGDAYTKSEADKEFHPLTTVDTAPTLNSSNLVTSGGVAKAVADLAESADGLYQRKGSYLTSSSALASANLDKNTISIAGTSVSLGGSITQNQLIANLGLKGLAFKDSIDLSGYATQSWVEGKDYLSKYGVAADSFKLGGVNASDYALKADYLPLTGGLITSPAVFGLRINYTGASSYTAIPFYKDNTMWGALGMRNDTPIFINAANSQIYNLIHSGNIGSYAIVPSIMTSEYLSRLTFNGTILTEDSDLNNIDFGYWASKNNFKHINSPQSNCSIICARLLTDGYKAQLILPYNNTELQYRSSYWTASGANWTAWKTIAFTDSTVAAANDALRAKTLVNDNGNSVIYNNSYAFYVGDNLYTTLPTYILGKSVVLRYGESATHGLILNSSGNVTIGSSDLAGTSAKLCVDGDINLGIGIAGHQFVIHKDGGFTFYGANDGWAFGMAARGYDRLTSLGSSAGSYGVTNNLHYHYYGGTWNDPYMVISPNRNVGIGTTNPNTKLHVVGGVKVEGALSTVGGGLTIDTSNSDIAITHYKGTTKLWTMGNYNGCANFSDALYVQSGSTPVRVATVNDLSSYLPKAGGEMTDGSRISHAKNMYIGRADNAGWVGLQDICSQTSLGDSFWSIRTNGVAHFQRIICLSTTGSHIIGNTNSEIIFQPSNDTSGANIPLKIAKTGSSTYTMYCDESEVYNLGTSSYKWNILYCRSASQSSDATLKNILGNVELTTSQIANAPAVNFTWKNGGTKDVGTIAQYWKNVLPEVVSGEEGSYGMNYAVLGVVSSIILARNIETHEQRIARLEKEISDLQKELDALVNNE